MGTAIRQDGICSRPHRPMERCGLTQAGATCNGGWAREVLQPVDDSNWMTPKALPTPTPEREDVDC